LALYVSIAEYSMSEAESDQPADIDDLLEIWAPELEHDGARLDVMPCPRLPPVGEYFCNLSGVLIASFCTLSFLLGNPLSAELVRTIEISRRDALSSILKKFPACGPKFVTWFRYGGYFSNIHVFVFDLEIPVKLNEVFTSSGVEFPTEDEAEERAAEAMIRKLEWLYKFEVVDLNWRNMRCFYRQNYNCCTGWRQAQEEIEELQIKVSALTKGWRRTLEGLDHACSMVPSEGMASPMDIAEGTFHDGITEFEMVAGKY
jgi:hypothetical protein